ncbi:hypothetical protein Glove_290g89 [Diversispora epigaea]|uniref:Uncharacterized protein n=1 Tax=Diversispora epigaea TaxID=1348612 RepID=A0A397I5S1_9GLOM|nr:hypothetical protein Glove_290g89 [Diversispora epigaea]
MNNKARTLLIKKWIDLSSSQSFTHKLIIRIFATNYCDSIGSIFKLLGAKKAFKKLESFTSIIGNYEEICSVYESLKLICNNILNMNLKLNTYHQVYLDSDSMFWQKEILKSLRLYSIYFCDFKATPIEQFTSLQKLYMTIVMDCLKSLNDNSSSEEPWILLISFAQIDAVVDVVDSIVMDVLDNIVVDIVDNVVADVVNIVVILKLSLVVHLCNKIPATAQASLASNKVLHLQNKIYDSSNEQKIRTTRYTYKKYFRLKYLKGGGVEKIEKDILMPVITRAQYRKQQQQQNQQPYP